MRVRRPATRGQVFTMHRHLPTAILTGLLVASPAWAQVVPAEGRSILRNGNFLEDPARPAGWVTRASTDLGKFDLLPPGQGEKSGILSVDVRSASQRPWTMELRQSIAQPLEDGEVLHITFEYKMSPGYAFLFYWQQAAAPWGKLLSIRFSGPADTWQTCAMVAGNHQNLAPGDTSVTFHLAAETGTVQFRNIAITVYPPGTDAKDLATNCQPVYGGDYYDNDWRNRILARIPQVRQRQLRVRVTKDGAPAPAAAVSVSQTSRVFTIGTSIAAPLFVDPLPEAKGLNEHRAKAEELRELLPKYRAKVAESGLFDIASPRQAFIWRDYAAWGKEVIPRVVETLAAHGLGVRGHAVYCPAFRCSPPECLDLRDRLLRSSLQKHILDQVTTYKGQIRQWDVVHAALTYDDIYDQIGEDSLVLAFRLAARRDPGAALAFSDDKALVSLSGERLEEVLALVKWLLAEGARVDVIALQANMTHPYIAPQAIEARLDKIEAELARPIVITSLAVESPEDSIQAGRLRDLLLLFFSHPAVSGVSLAGIWEPAMPNGSAALFRQDFSAKPAAVMFEKLLKEDWHTQATATTDATGVVTIAAFLGQYDIAVQLGEDRATKKLTLTEDGAEAVFEF